MPDRNDPKFLLNCRNTKYNKQKKNEAVSYKHLTQPTSDLV